LPVFTPISCQLCLSADPPSAVELLRRTGALAQVGAAFPNLSRPSGIAYQFVIEIIKGTLKINPSITVLTLEVAFGINHIKGGLNE